MEIINNIFTVIGLILLCLGTIVFVFEVIGIFKYKFVLNRMHAAGMGDTLGIFLCLVGLICLEGFTFTDIKFAIVVVFLWFTSPTATHLIAGLEALTDDEIAKYAKIEVDDLKSYVDGHIENKISSADFKDCDDSVDGAFADNGSNSADALATVNEIQKEGE